MRKRQKSSSVGGGGARLTAREYKGNIFQSDVFSEERTGRRAKKKPAGDVLSVLQVTVLIQPNITQICLKKQ